jgi:pentose-5-phosphate-3-epimerase
MIEIIPAVLPKNLRELEEALSRLQHVAPLVQVDLVGGNILENEEAMPFWEDFDFEMDIMLPSPSREVRRCIELGASRVVVHASAKDAPEALSQLQETRQGEFRVEVGVALASHDAPEALAPFDGLYDYVQVMGIDHIGKQGEPPDPHRKEIELIKGLRRRHPELVIQVDGAAAAHPEELADAGATRLIVGSAIVAADNPKKELQRLYNLVNARS